MSIKNVVIGRAAGAWGIVLGVTLLGALLGALLGFGGQTVYTAQASMYVTPPTSSTPTDAVMAGQYATNRTQLYLELIKSDELARRVAAALGTSEPPNAIAARITATSLHQTSILAIEARGSSADDARSLANSYVKELPEYARSVERNSGLREDAPMAPVELPVSVESSKSGLTPWLPVLGGAALLGIPAAAVVWAIRRRHPAVGDAEAAREALSVPFVETVDSDIELDRAQTMVLTMLGATKVLLVVSPRAAVSTERFTMHLIQTLERADAGYERGDISNLAELSTGLHSQHLVILDAPGILDRATQLERLADRRVAAVIVVHRGRTLIEDISETQRHLELLKIDNVLGVVIDRPGRKASGKPTDTQTNPADDESWPRIDVLEQEEAARTGRRHA